jgi:uncharacterized coiled-coil protein SlyX
MISSKDEHRAMQQVVDLEPRLAAVEAQISALGAALREHDVTAVDSAAAQLHVALATALDDFTRAARTGGVPPVLRQRLALAGGQVAAQREALARATASLDRAIDALLARQTASGLYSAAGSSDRMTGAGGALLA